MQVKRLKELREPVIQNLIPVLTDDLVLRGFIHIPVTTFDTANCNICIDCKHYPLTTLQFTNDRFVSRVIFCMVFPMTLGHGRNKWNGIHGFITPADFGIMSIWASPVGTANYQRNTLGLCSMFLKKWVSRADVQTIGDEEVYSVKLQINIPAKQFSNRYASVSFKWYDAFMSALTKRNIYDKVVSIDVVNIDPDIRVIRYGESIPDHLQLMAMKNGLKGEKIMLFTVKGEEHTYSMTLYVSINSK